MNYDAIGENTVYIRACCPISVTLVLLHCIVLHCTVIHPGEV